MRVAIGVASRLVATDLAERGAAVVVPSWSQLVDPPGILAGCESATGWTSNGLA